jgi:hypothetical protein
VGCAHHLSPVVSPGLPQDSLSTPLVPLCQRGIPGSSKRGHPQTLGKGASPLCTPVWSAESPLPRWERMKVRVRHPRQEPLVQHPVGACPSCAGGNPCARGHQTTPFFPNRARSSFEKPSSPTYTSSLCSPIRGVRRLMSQDASEKATQGRG